MDDRKNILDEYARSVRSHYENEQYPRLWYPSFRGGPRNERNRHAWVKENNDRFLEGTPNRVLFSRWYCSELGAITALEYAPGGGHVVAGHASGVVQMRHGGTGAVLCTLRNVQFPPRPVHALRYGRPQERACYAACADGAVYRVEIPHLDTSGDDPPEYCIRADPALECLNAQFYGTPGISSYSTPFVTQRPAALSLGLTADRSKLAVGYADNSIKVYDMETQEALLTYKVHKLRLQFIPRKLQRMHSGAVCALRCHPQRAHCFASAAWDRTLRIWDVRCEVGCVMTFEGVNVCADSIDLNREQCLTGSWQPTEALALWDLTAKKRLHAVRAQNRRPDVDGEYLYACRYWRSEQFNRKGKYGVVGGSGTGCVEVINLHNRYVACSYPARGHVLAVASRGGRVAFGGTAPFLGLVSFRDPKHEPYEPEPEPEPVYGAREVAWFDDRSSAEDSEPPAKPAPSAASRGALGARSAASAHRAAGASTIKQTDV